jgi:hypothetical protein
MSAKPHGGAAGVRELGRFLSSRSRRVPGLWHVWGQAVSAVRLSVEDAARQVRLEAQTLRNVVGSVFDHSSLTHLFIHSLTHSLIHSQSVHSLTDAFID